MSTRAHAKTATLDDRVRRRLRATRLDRGMSLDALAARSGISASTISRLETGGRRLAMDQLVPLATALQVGLDDLVAEVDDEDVVLRPTVERRGDIAIWPLTRQRTIGQPSVFKLVLSRTRTKPEFGSHPGREWLFVLSGTLRLRLDDRELLLGPGQVAEFATTTPHWHGVRGGPVELLVIFDSDAERAHLTRH